MDYEEEDLLKVKDIDYFHMMMDVDYFWVEVAEVDHHLERQEECLQSTLHHHHY